MLTSISTSMEHPEDLLNLEYLEMLHGSLSDFLESSFLHDIECTPYLPSTPPPSKFYAETEIDISEFISAYECSDDLQGWDLVEIIDFSC